MRLTDPNTGRRYVEKRRQRYPVAGHSRELTFSCYRHYPLLAVERVRTSFGQALAAAQLRFGVRLWAYVIMPDHVHLLVYPGNAPREIPDFLRAIKEPVARKAIAALEACAPEWLARLTVREGQRERRRFWQPGTGYDRNVTRTAVLRSMIEYIHANPVRRGLVQKAEEWEWSSACWYAGIRPVPIEMDAGAIDELVWE